MKAQNAVTMGDQVTQESQLSDGELYLIFQPRNGSFIAESNNQYDALLDSSPLSTGAFYFIRQNNGTFKIKNFITGNYFPILSTAGIFSSTSEENAGTYNLQFDSNGAIYPICADNADRYGWNRGSNKLWATTGVSTTFNDARGSGNVYLHKIYKINKSTTPLSEFADKDISVNSTEAASLTVGQWYVMRDRGRNAYLYEKTDGHTLYNQSAAPSGTATENAKFLVRLVDAGGGKYYIQNGLGNYFGIIPQNTTVPMTALNEEKMTVAKINNTDGHFYIQGESNNIILDCQDPGYPVVGWGTTIPTGTGGNNDWAFYSVTLVDSWAPTAADVYTINNTNSGRGALTYEPSKSTEFVWSSGKSGATAFDASNANHQWVIYPTGTSGQFYLYNVGADKFAIPTGIAQSNAHSWVFSDNAVAVVFELQDDGTKKIKMANNPVSGNNQAYMGVSNGYTGPIINWNDDGSKFTITKVDGVDASSAVTTAVNNLVYNSSTALTGAVSEDDGWYVIQIKTTSNTTATASPGRYVYPGPTGNDNYPLTFTGGVDCQPSIKDATFYTRFVKNGSVYNWQLPNGQYLVQNSGNLFPTLSSEAAAVTPGYNNGSYINGGSRYADPYVSSGNFFIGETASYRTTWNIYPINLSNAGLTAWQMICDNAPETQEITCSRSDVSGLTSVYKNGFIFLPTGVTPESTDFTLGGATDIVVDATNHKVNFTYDPNLAIVIDGVTVAQGWQTAGRDNEVMLMRVNAKPFKDATGTMMTVSLKDGAEANISKLTLYEASSESPEIYSTGTGAPTKTVVAEVNNPSATAAFSIGSFAAGQHYYWIGATVKSDATLGDILDAAVTGITYTCNGNETTLDLTSVGDPADRGAIVFNAHSYPYLPRDNGSRVYRIPAMIVADDGSIVVAADKRYESYTDIGAGHVIDIVIRRSTDGGKTWSDPKVVAKGLGTADDAKCGYGDPSLVKGKDGKLYCLFVAGNLGYFYGQQRIAMTTSSDNGVTWSSNETTPPIDLLESGRLKNYNTVGQAGYGLYDYFVTSGRGLYIPDDDILMYLIPAQTMTSATEHTGDSQDYIFYSRDGGESWYFSETPMINGGDEAKIIQMNDGSLFGSIRKYGDRRFNTATYSKNDDGKTLSFTFGTQWDNSQLHQDSQNNQDILYYQRETETGKTDVIIHSITTGNHANFKLYYSTDQGINWTEFLNVQTKGARYVTMDKNPANGSLYLFFEDQSLNSAGGYTDYNHYPLNFIEITRDHLKKYITTLDDLANVNPVEGVKVVYGMTGHADYGTLNGLTWTSKVTSGITTGDNTIAGLTMVASDGAFNQFSSWNDHFNLAYQPAANNTPATLTLTAPAGYAIESYSMLLARASSATHTYTVASESGTSVDVPFGSKASSYATLEETGINAKSTAITVTTSDVGKWLAIADFVVNLKRAVEYKVVDGNGNEWASQTVIFDTNSVVDEMPQSLKRAFCTYSYYSDAECTTAVTNIGDLATIYVKCEYDGPFEFSTIDNPKWYFVHSREQNNIDANDYFANANGTTWQTTAQTDIKTLYSNTAYQWAFVGNPYAVKLVNRASGNPLAASAKSGNNGSEIPLSVTNDTNYPYNEFTVYDYAGVLGEGDGVINPFVLILKDSYYGFLIYNGTMKYYSSGVSITEDLGLRGWRSSDLMVIEVPSTYQVSFNAVGDKSYATLYLPFDVTTDDNTKAYYIETVADGVATLTELSEGKIPTKTAVVLINDGAATEAVFSVASGLTEAISEDNNMLKGTLVPMELDLSQNSPNYSMGRKDGKIGFYKFNNNGTTTITLGANKAYLDTGSTTSSKGFTFSFGDPSGIDQVGTDVSVQMTDVIYNLSGQRVNRLTKGLYIVNGKKVVIK